jgi:transcriptional regulator with XRE-family HTH domain
LNAIPVGCNLAPVRSLGRVVRRLRVMQRLSQREVATHGRLSSATRVSEFERGTDVQLSTIIGVFRGLGVPPMAVIQEWRRYVAHCPRLGPRDKSLEKEQLRADENNDTSEAGVGLRDEARELLLSALTIARSIVGDDAALKWAKAVASVPGVLVGTDRKKEQA